MGLGTDAVTASSAGVDLMMGGSSENDCQPREMKFRQIRCTPRVWSLASVHKFGALQPLYTFAKPHPAEAKR